MTSKPQASRILVENPKGHGRHLRALVGEAQEHGMISAVLYTERHTDCLLLVGLGLLREGDLPEDDDRDSRYFHAAEVTP